MPAQPKPGTFPFQVAALNARQAGQAVKTQDMIITSEVNRHLERIEFWGTSVDFWGVSVLHWRLTGNEKEEANSKAQQTQAIEVARMARDNLVNYVLRETRAAYNEGYRDSGNMQAE